MALQILLTEWWESVLLSVEMKMYQRGIEISQELGECSRRKAAGGRVKRQKKTAGDLVHSEFICLCYDELFCRILPTKLFPRQRVDVFVVFCRAHSNRCWTTACWSSFCCSNICPMALHSFQYMLYVFHSRMFCITVHRLYRTIATLHESYVQLHYVLICPLSILMLWVLWQVVLQQS